MGGEENAGEAGGVNYAPNTIHWRAGDVVIHDADAKEPRMLMRVIGFTRDGLVKTQYVDGETWGAKVYENKPQILHDPKQFGFTAATPQADWELIRRWNRRCEAGCAVVYTDDLGGQTRTQTRSEAQLLEYQRAVIWLDGIDGCCDLRRVEVAA
jgi:hypothetical protein